MADDGDTDEAERQRYGYNMLLLLCSLAKFWEETYSKWKIMLRL